MMIFRIEDEDLSKNNIEMMHLSVELEGRASSTPPAPPAQPSPPPSPQLVVTSCLPDLPTSPTDTCITIEPSKESPEDCTPTEK